MFTIHEHFACPIRQARIRSRTMRVIVTQSVTKDDGQRCSVAGPEWLDLREEPAAVERIDAARQHPSLRSLLLNLNAEESPFATFGCKVWAATESAGAEPSVFASRIDLLLAHRPAERDGAQYEDLANELAKLLDREPGDALRVEVHISPAQFVGGRQGFCLRLILFARAVTQEQARLRWSLGLARVQQALLFLARAIRQNRVSLD